MSQTEADVSRSVWDTAKEVFLRVAATGLVPATLFQRRRPADIEITPRTGQLSLEIVTHCWNYDFLLAYQLSSLVNHSPQRISVTMTVFYTPEDVGTARILEYFGSKKIERVEWNWQPLERSKLLRRSIGRNLAAQSSRADWVWFTDCDVIFHEGCLDTLAERLQGRRDPIVHPQQEHCTPLLSHSDPMLTAAAGAPKVVEIDPARFVVTRTLAQATGPMQITHGDVARAFGYCDALGPYQKPTDRWRKCYEDRAFRWLLRTAGSAIDVPGVYRIRHASKGRYAGSRTGAAVRGSSRRTVAWVLEKFGRRGTKDER